MATSTTSGSAVTSANPIRLLVVEDEEHLAAGLKLNFELEGYQVDLARSGREAGNLLLSDQYDVIVLDVMLPDINGFTLCAKLRESGNVTPVMMLTARSSVDDRIEGLNVGADDYVTKPFELEELLARVQAMVRRSGWDRSRADAMPEVLTIGGHTVDFEKHVTTAEDGTEVHLTKLEYDLLRYFVNNPGRVLQREELQEQVWKLRDYPNRRMVDNFILRLRRHFEDDPKKPRLFLSVRGAGYKYVPE